jgi:hypothetical protein
MNSRPLGVSKHHNSHPAAFKILLVSNILVGGEQDIESRFFRRLQQFAVAQSVHPLAFACVTVWSTRKRAMLRGVSWSKRTSIAREA